MWLDVTINADGNETTHTTPPWSIDRTTPRSVDRFTRFPPRRVELQVTGLPVSTSTGTDGSRPSLAGRP